jgi:hypothetical protein
LPQAERYARALRSAAASLETLRLASSQGYLGKLQIIVTLSSISLSTRSEIYSV